MMMFIEHLPALQILICFFAALIIIFTQNIMQPWPIAMLAALCSLILSIYGMVNIDQLQNYNFGPTRAPFGIEYSLTPVNQPIIIFINFVFFFFLFFGRELIASTVTSYIEESRIPYFYSLLLLAHGGYAGVVSTNDLFNLYVFIEISSLATYVLMAKGRHKYSMIGAFDYLVLGTIGATLILISIGLLLTLTGSLNISDIASIIDYSIDKNHTLILASIAFFLAGSILKMAFFPMHFWMLRAYTSTSPYILTYIASISGLIGTYLILKFIFFVVEGAEIQQAISFIFRPLSLATILICSLMAFRSKNLKITVIYSSAAQTGYIFLMMSIWTAQDVMFMLIILDALNKISLFTIISLMEDKNESLNYTDVKYIDHSTRFKFLTFFALMFSMSLPITSSFFVKMQMLSILFESNLIYEIIIVIMASALTLLYHLKIGKAVYFAPVYNGKIRIESQLYGLAAIVMVQLFSLFYLYDLSIMAKYAESIILKS